MSGSDDNITYIECDDGTTVLVIVDGPGDTTVRPARPLLRKLAEEERRKIELWEKKKQAKEAAEEKPDNTSSDESQS